jgi:hypothetical protein
MSVNANKIAMIAIASSNKTQAFDRRFSGGW